MPVDDAVRAALARANQTRFDAFLRDDVVLHAAADVEMLSVRSAAELEALKARMRERGVIVDEPQKVAADDDFAEPRTCYWCGPGVPATHTDRDGHDVCLGCSLDDDGDG